MPGAMQAHGLTKISEIIPTILDLSGAHIRNSVFAGPHIHGFNLSSGEKEGTREGGKNRGGQIGAVNLLNIPDEEWGADNIHAGNGATVTGANGISALRSVTIDDA